MLTPSIGACVMPLTSVGRLDAGRLQDGRHDVDHMVELGADAALVLDRSGQEIAMPCRVPPKCEATCLVHLKGVSKAQAQPTAMCGLGLPGAPSRRNAPCWLDAAFGHAVVAGIGVQRAGQRALGTGAVVAEM